MLLRDEKWVEITTLIRWNKDYTIDKIVDFTGMNYFISNTGELKRNNYKMKSNTSKDKNFYIYNTLTDIDGNVHTVSRHQLVGQYFMSEDINEYLSIDHIDRNPMNNNLENLRWADMRIQSKNKNIKGINSIPVIQLTLDGEFVREYSSAVEAENYGFKRGCICEVCKGRRAKTHKGFKFIYKKEYMEVKQYVAS